VLAAHSIDVRHGNDAPIVLANASVTLNPGELVCVVGPNGSGKSTLVQALARTLAPSSGVVVLDQVDLYKDLTAREAAQTIGVVPQTTDVFLDFTVRDTIAMGRAPWRQSRGMLSPDSADDEAAVERAIQQMDLPRDLVDRPISHVSGGERQRAIVARMLAQEAKIMLLDEPTSALDLAAQSRLLTWLRRQACEQQKAVMVVLHDLNLAAAHADRLVVLHNGAVFADGPPKQVLTADTIASVYGVHAWVRANPLNCRPTVLAIPELAPGFDGSALSGSAVHLLCGSSTGANLMFQLVRFGARVTLSVLCVSDSDADAADSLGLAYTKIGPFELPTADDWRRDTDLAESADAAILTQAHFGDAEASMAASAMSFMKSGRPLVVIRGDSHRFELEAQLAAAGAPLFVESEDRAIAVLAEVLAGRN